MSDTEVTNEEKSGLLKATDYFTYPEIVRNLIKSGEEIINELTPWQADLWHCSTGVAGEGGELLDAVKKHVIYQRPIDRDNVIEELGDLEFYMERVRQLLQIERHETLDANVEKLKIRYPGVQYSNQSAIDRADKI